MKHPKGKLIAIGGAEDKGTDLEVGEIHRSNLNFFELGILRQVVEQAGGPSSRIEIITTASMIPYEVGENYLNAFGKVGCTNVDLMHIRNRRDATYWMTSSGVRPSCNSNGKKGRRSVYLSSNALP